jgi:hypothetical protein
MRLKPPRWVLRKTLVSRWDLILRSIRGKWSRSIWHRTRGYSGLESANCGPRRCRNGSPEAAIQNCSISDAAKLLVTTDCIGIPEVGMEGPVLRAVTAR